MNDSTTSRERELRVLAEQAEAAKRQNQHYQSLVESTTAIIWEGNPDTLAFRYVSPECEKLLGYTPEEWISDPRFWQRHIHPDDHDWALEYSATWSTCPGCSG